MSYLQCPNPNCGSNKIVTSEGSITLAPDPLSRFVLSNRFIYVVLIAIVLGPAFMLILYLIVPGLSEALGEFSGWAGWSPFLLLVVYFSFYSRANKIKVYQFKCNICRFQWHRVEPRPELVETRIQWMEAMLAEARKKADRRKIAPYLIDLGAMVSRYHNDWQQGVEYCEEALEILERQGEKKSFAYALNNLGFSLTYVGEWSKATPLLEKSVALFRELGEWQGYSAAINSLGLSVLYQGQYERARFYFEESLVLKRKMGETGESFIWDIEGLAGVAAGQRLPVRAAQLCGAAKARREVTGGILPLTAHRYFQQTVEAIQSQLDPASFQAAWQAGTQMEVEQLFEFATRPLEAVG